MSQERKPPSKEYVAGQRAMQALGETLEHIDEIIAHIAELPSQRAQFRDEYVVIGPDGPITTANHESLAWTLGESIRRTLVRRRALRKDQRLWQAIEAIALDTSVGSGREPFVMLLGQYGGKTRSALLVRLLDDPQVQGHALYALRRLGAPNGKEKAQGLAGHRRTWVRNEAKKYLAKISR